MQTNIKSIKVKLITYIGKNDIRLIHRHGSQKIYMHYNIIILAYY
jgi:hypothetical protein